MTDRSEKSSGAKKMVSSLTANQRARVMVITLAGPRDWLATREAWLAGVARQTKLSLRRVKAIFYQEPIRLGADEYIAIQSRFDRLNIDIETAYAALAPRRNLASITSPDEGGVAREEIDLGKAALIPSAQPKRDAAG